VLQLLENRKEEGLSEQLLESQDKANAHNRSRVQLHLGSKCSGTEFVHNYKIWSRAICELIFLKCFPHLTLTLSDKLSDDPEDIMCFTGINHGALWSIWRW
jgi:hypothetical protein